LRFQRAGSLHTGSWLGDAEASTASIASTASAASKDSAVEEEAASPGEAPEEEEDYEEAEDDEEDGPETWYQGFINGEAPPRLVEVSQMTRAGIWLVNMTTSSFVYSAI